MKKRLKVPKFKNEDQEREFWSKIDVTEYFEPSDFERAYFPNLRPTSKAISIRMPEYMILELKQKANAIDIPYQALIKKYVADGMVRDAAIAKKK